MKKPTITQKRATLYREWILAGIGNDERYYMYTLSCGIPDGDDRWTVMEDLQDGCYDDDIDETIQVYLAAKDAYGASGYYLNGTVYRDENQALEATGLEIPEKIMMRRRD